MDMALDYKDSINEVDWRLRRIDVTIKLFQHWVGFVNDNEKLEIMKVRLWLQKLVNEIREHVEHLPVACVKFTKFLTRKHPLVFDSSLPRPKILLDQVFLVVFLMEELLRSMQKVGGLCSDSGTLNVLMNHSDFRTVVDNHKKLQEIVNEVLSKCTLIYCHTGQ